MIAGFKKEEIDRMQPGEVLDYFYRIDKYYRSLPGIRM
jgi:hypothetical protein